jgi:hypothetical protein
MGTDLRQPPGTDAGDAPGPGTTARTRPGALGVLGAALALVLVFAGVRLTASPSPPVPAPSAPSPPAPSLFDLPTRGSLADDAAWVDGVRRGVPPTDLPGARTVAYAGEVAGQRVALVLGRQDRRVEGAWLVGPLDAAPEQMHPATAPLVVAPYGPVALWDAPDPRTGLLVVVTLPGDAVDVLARRSVTADGVERQVRVRLPAPGGVTAELAAVPVAESERSWGARVVVLRDGVETTGTDVLSDRALAIAAAPVDPADPRGLRALADEPLLQLLVHQLMGTYGLPAGELDPVLLAAVPVGTAGDQAVLVGATLPSGATVAALGVVGTGEGDPVPRTVRTAPSPAGAAIGDRILAVPAGWAVSRLPVPLADNPPPGWLVVSGPAAGARADVLDVSGAVVAALPLAGGTGTGPVDGQAAAVRVVDAAGAVLGEAPVTGLTR